MKLAAGNGAPSTAGLDVITRAGHAHPGPGIPGPYRRRPEGPARRAVVLLGVGFGGQFGFGVVELAFDASHLFRVGVLL